MTEAQTEESALEETEVPTETTTEVKHYSVMEGAANLLSINPEVIGYLSIPDTEVDYPVMQHPNDVEGDEYYLHHDLQVRFSWILVAVLTLWGQMERLPFQTLIT